MQNHKENARLRRLATVYNDDGGRETIVAYGNWDTRGNWRTVSETGFGVPGTRTTHTDYFAISRTNVFLTGLYNYREVHDGQRVLEHTDYQYNTLQGRLEWSIARNTFQGGIGTPRKTNALKGDVKTTYTYNSATKLLESKTISTGGDGSATADYCIGYTWSLGAQLKTKTFKDCATGVPLPWKAIERKRDGNTGLIYSTTDTAGFQTGYRYDTLGRIIEILPPGTEHRTRIDYVSLRATEVTRNPDSPTDFGFSRYTYDGLGRLVCEERRLADTTGPYPFQTTRYDILNRAVFKSEWLPATGTICNPETNVGTRFEYGADPFGRLKSSTTTYGKVTSFTYQGQDSTVTVEGVMGTSGVEAPVETRFFRDGWGQLIMVDAPNGGGADAIYSYDLRGNLVQVDLYDQANPARVQSRYFEYDALNHLSLATNPESATVTYTEYDGLGNIHEMTDAAGTAFRYTYDPASRLTRVEAIRSGTTTILEENTYDAGSNAFGKLSTSRSYGEAGVLVLAKSVLYEIAPSVGLNGRPSAVEYALPGVASPLRVTYGYDNFGNISQTVYPEGLAGKGGALTVTYEMSNGFPKKVKEGATDLAGMTFNRAGGLASITTPGGARTEILPDDQNRPSDITIGTWNGNAFQGTPFYASGAYSYDGAGNIYQVGPDAGPRNRYRYDAASRLREAYEQYPDGATTYTQCFKYDDFGNLAEKVDRVTTQPCSDFAFDPDVLLTYAVDSPLGPNTNRILNEQRKGMQNVVNFYYDANGNLQNDWGRRYLYDTRNRLASLLGFSVPGDTGTAVSELARYDYDGDGNRVVKRDRKRGLNTFYVRGLDGKVLSEFRRTTLGTYQPEWSKHYVYLAGKEVALRENRVPNPPGGLTVKRGTSSSRIEIRWLKSPPEDNVTSYKLYRRVNGGSWSLIGTFDPGVICFTSPNDMCYVNFSLTSGTRYDYQVTAVSAAGPSYGSDVNWMQAGDVTPPNPPTCLTGTVGDGKVSLSWTGSTSLDVMGYYIYRGSLSTNVNSTLVLGTTYIDNGLMNDTTYSYWVTAVDNAGNQSFEVVNDGCQQPGTFTATPSDFTPPAPPRDPRAAADCAGNPSIEISWQPSLDADVTGYLIDRDPPFNPPGPRTSASLLSHTDSGLTEIRAYTYWIFARDSRGNISGRSLKASATLRLPAGQLSPPSGQLIAIPGNGQVKVSWSVGSASPGVQGYVLYRRANSEPSCATFSRIVEGWINIISLTDGAALNGIAWDYAVASRDAAGNESGLSRIALAIPIASPTDYRECVEASGVSTDLSINCGFPTNPYRRVAMRWNPPSAKPYQPLTASSADGPLGYQQGYRVARYRNDLSDGADSPVDASALVEDPMHRYASAEARSYNQRFSIGLDECDKLSPLRHREACVSMGTCVMDGDVSCSTSADCVTGTTCHMTCNDPVGPRRYCTTASDCPAECRSLVCTNDLARPCQSPADCPGTFQCSGPGVCDLNDTPSEFDNPPCLQKADCPATAFCDRFGPNLYSEQPIPTDPYLLDHGDPVEYFPYRNIGNLAHCAMVSAVYKVFANGNWQTVVSPPTANFDTDQIYSDPSAAAARCRRYALDACDAAAPACSPDTEPPAVTSPPTTDPTTDVESGKVRVFWIPPTDTSRVAGYYLYVRENSIGSLGLRPASPYGFLRPVPFTTLGPDATYHDLDDLPSTGRGGRASSYQFQVATFDPQGRVSAVSPMSAPRSGTSVALKTVIWTVNDAIEDGASYGYPNPRGYDGIKVEWRAGNRLYRSESEHGTYCAILRQGPNNPPGTCLDDTAYSDSLTTGAAGTNTQFFLDRNVVPGKVYYYKVAYFNGTTLGELSKVAKGMALKHAPQPLSPPRHLRASAPLRGIGGGLSDPGVFLRWCPNPPEEGVTAYRIYRSLSKEGSYTLLAQIDNPMDPVGRLNNCLMGSRRCQITSATVCVGEVCPTISPNPSCTTGRTGTCRIVDLTVQQPLTSSGINEQRSRVYFYRVTAVRGAEESPYSEANAGWPSYDCPACPNRYLPRYDHDDHGDIACDDEMAFLEGEEREAVEVAGNTGGPEGGTLDEAATVTDFASISGLAPYRVIGAMLPGSGGGGGGGSAAPSGTPRWLFYHTDHLGNPRVVTDMAGAVVSKHHFMPFGDEKPLPASRVSANTHMFTGHERDFEGATNDTPDGLDYMLARYYSSGLAKFTSPDPLNIIAYQNGSDQEREVFEDYIQRPQTWNKYAYVENNPVRYDDPHGLCAWDACAAEIGAGIATWKLVTLGAATVGTFWLASRDNADLFQKAMDILDAAEREHVDNPKHPPHNPDDPDWKGDDNRFKRKLEEAKRLLDKMKGRARHYREIIERRIEELLKRYQEKNPPQPPGPKPPGPKPPGPQPPKGSYGSDPWRASSK